jgi:hypothetical protein
MRSLHDDIHGRPDGSGLLNGLILANVVALAGPLV